MMLNHRDTRLAAIDARHDTDLARASFWRRILPTYIVQFTFAIKLPPYTLHRRAIIPGGIRCRRCGLVGQIRHIENNFAIARHRRYVERLHFPTRSPVEDYHCRVAFLLSPALHLDALQQDRSGIGGWFGREQGVG
ncbi:hypothetical protein D3C79_863740 [compost metagenome]